LSSESRRRGAEPGRAQSQISGQLLVLPYQPRHKSGAIYRHSRHRGCFVRNNGGVFVASPPWRISSCKINARVKSQKGGNRFVHRDMHSLAASVDFGCIERGEDTLGCREPGHEVSNGGTNLVRWSIAWSGQIHYSGLALHDYIVAGSILLRSAVAKTR